MSTFTDARVRNLNSAAPHSQGRYVLYWMQLFRRLNHNHALDYAVRWAASLGKPVVVYEGLRLDYPWASVRHHRFILEGMQANAAAAGKLGLTYWPFVATTVEAGRGLLRKLAAESCGVVTDDYPAFIVPGQSAALAQKVTVPVVAVDGNSVVPLSLLGTAVSAAAHLRPRIHRLFADAWPHRAQAEPQVGKAVALEPPFAVWNPQQDLTAFLDQLPLERSVPAVPGVVGGSPAAQAVLSDFLHRKLSRYAEHRSDPDALDRCPASTLSPYLHYGHISIEDVIARVLARTGKWTLAALNSANRGKREGFYCADVNVNSFLDEAITWRDVGYQWHYHRGADTANLQTALPEWAWKSLSKHAADKRTHTYSAEQWENADTHDPLWNAAQRELVATGRIHNYLRMLWGKKVLEWSATPEQAYQTLVHLNNKYALDGRDPNSYTGILWTFGLFDRPWAPERPVYGVIRYMSSDNTAKKFRLKPYHEYVATLPTPAAVRVGQTQSATLFS